MIPPTQKIDSQDKTTLAKRALLYDIENRFIGYFPFAEIDRYLELNWVERLTPVRSHVHAFRLKIETLIELCRYSDASLNAETNQANAGACDDDFTIRWARRKVRKWPFVGDTKAVRVACRA